MALTFAVPDLHGRFDLMRRALERISAAASGGRVVFLGDYVDRGPQSAEVLARLIEGPPSGWNWTVLLGNHEAMMRDSSLDSYMRARWLANGGAATLASYGDASGMDVTVLPRSHLDFISALPLFFTDAQRVYVHAYVDPDLPLAAQAESRLIWARYGDRDTGHAGRHVVHGHTPVAAGPVRLAHRTNLDTGAVFTGRLVVGVFDDALPGGPVDVLEVAGGT